MRRHLLAASALALVSSMASAVTVTNTYLNNTMTEIRGQLGSYARPTLYINQRACGEPSPNAMACGPYIISVGTSFLQGQESSHGNYAAKMVLAHEFGHSIQFTNNIRLSSPYQELQADCTGGSFVKYAESSLRYPSFLAAAVSSARAAADYSTHGSPAQRDYYTRWGYANGVSRCFNNLPRV